MQPMTRRTYEPRWLELVLGAGVFFFFFFAVLDCSTTVTMPSLASTAALLATAVRDHVAPVPATAMAKVASTTYFIMLNILP
jgi:hypothetical protein